jgi:hypothetical protein
MFISFKIYDTIYTKYRYYCITGSYGYVLTPENLFGQGWEKVHSEQLHNVTNVVKLPHNLQIQPTTVYTNFLFLANFQSGWEEK